METTTVQSPEVKTAIASLREKAPFIYGLTNYVAANLSANVLLALGAGPAIGAAPGFTTAFPAGAGAVWINGAALMSSVTPEALEEAAATAHTAGTPWVLDPVAIGAGAGEYDEILTSLLKYEPSIIRGNASEISALAGGAGGSGVDSTLDSSEVIDTVKDLAVRLDAVVAVSGEVDYLCDPSGRATSVTGGDAKMPQVTGTGCSLGALSAAYCAVVDPFTAARAAHAAFAAAGERAGARTTGTGSFAVAFLDELSTL
ncbi:hydroxyethylthiazole kinase [Gordonia metallireducens]|uniref:hydroxyethylthiazole kinase n=1 Tax=Gordonia metallireducens TaxID=2897779 RepID=UPI001E2FC4EF|nr:hydroxyethylthiazole kinase [Gordonia metallireducens]